MGSVRQALRVRGLRPLQNRRGSGLEYLRVVLAEFQRAMAAEQRYEYLRRTGIAALARDGVVRADLPRRIFEEFYASSAEPRHAAPWRIENLGGPGRSTSPSTNRRTRRSGAKPAVACRYAAGGRAI
jgi:hypothetical protein